MVSSSSSVSGEHFNYPLPLQPILKGSKLISSPCSIGVFQTAVHFVCFLIVLLLLLGLG